MILDPILVKALGVILTAAVAVVMAGLYSRKQVTWPVWVFTILGFLLEPVLHSLGGVLWVAVGLIASIFGHDHR